MTVVVCYARWYNSDDWPRTPLSTQALQNTDELFKQSELSAACDVGWPDCFNSGMFVFVPSQDTYAKLIEFAKTTGSFDGGDQGLLNSYFPTWNRLSFVYNMVASAAYTYLPAFKQWVYLTIGIQFDN